MTEAPSNPSEPPNAPPPPEADAATAPSKEERTLAMVAHLLGIVTLFVGPLIIWLIKREESPFINDQGKEALNFELTMTIAVVACVVLSAIPLIGLLFTCLLLPALWLANLIMCILAGVKANEGETYRHPVTLRLIK